MLLQSAAMVAKKLPVDDKIAACVKQICLLGVFAFLKNGCYQYLNFVLRVTYCCFTNCRLAHSQLSWKVFLFSCNPIGQLCLSRPGHSNRTVKLPGSQFK